MSRRGLEPREVLSPAGGVYHTIEAHANSPQGLDRCGGVREKLIVGHSAVGSEDAAASEDALP